MAKSISKKKAVADYDRESDSLALTIPGNKASGSLEFGDLIVDLNSRKEVAGIEFLNASELISSMSGTKVTQDMLSHIEGCELYFKTVGNQIIIHFVLLMPDKTIEDNITIPLISEKKIEAII